MTEKQVSEQELMAYLASDNGPAALIAAGWTPSALRAAGWTPSDLAEADADWDSIPALPNLYTNLANAIESGDRKHDQQTWGPDADPGQNLCGTAMCTAGHLVNMAGPAGYALRHKYGWAGAARMIHAKNRPDVPPQNFGSIPQKFAMAYIRQRAAEEAAETAKAESA